MLENWIKDYQILKRISKHYKTGEPLSDELITKINAVDKDHKGTETLFQVMLGTFDLLIHTAHDEEVMSLAQKSDDLKSYSAYVTTPYEFSIDSLRKSMKMKGTKVDTGDLWKQMTKIMTF